MKLGRISTEEEGVRLIMWLTSRADGIAGDAKLANFHGHRFRKRDDGSLRHVVVDWSSSATAPVPCLASAYQCQECQPKLQPKPH